MFDKSSPGRIIARIPANSTDAEIHIEGVIAADSFWGDTYSLAQMRADLAASKAKSVRVVINSPGGGVSEGVAIYHALRESGKTINTVASGIAASIASVIFMAGDTRTVNLGSRVMIHNPWMPYTSGDAKSLRQQADVLDGMAQDIIDIYAKVSGTARAKLAELLDAETWMSAAEAKAHGFATAIGGATANARLASYAMAVFKNLPEDLKHPEINDKHTMNAKILALLGVTASASEQEVETAVAALKNSAAALVAKESEVAALNTKLTEANAKIEGFENAAKEAAAKALKTEARAFADKAVADKRILPDAADKWASAYEKDAEQAKALLPAAPTGDGHHKSLDCGSNAGGGNVPADVAALFAAYQAETEPAKKHAAYLAWEKATAK